MDTTAEGYYEKGWYPGKKTSALKRLGQYASFGMYQPNDAHLSELNFDKAQQSARLKMQEEMAQRERRDAANVNVDTAGRMNEVANKQKRDLDALIMEMTRDHLVNAYGMDPAEAMQVAHQTVTSGQLSKIAGDEADTAEHQNRRAFADTQAGYMDSMAQADAEAKIQKARADRQTAENVETRGAGEAPFAFNEGMTGADAAISDAKAKRARAQNAESYEQEYGNIGGPRTEAETRMGGMQRQQSENALGKLNADFDMDVNRATNPSRWKVALDNAATTADMSTAQNKLMRENAPAIAGANINKQSGITVPYGATMQVPIPVGGTNTLSGLKAQGEHTMTIKPNLLGGYSTNYTGKMLGPAPTAPGTNAPGSKRISLDDLQRILSNTNSIAK